MTALTAFTGVAVLLLGILSLPVVFCGRIRLAQAMAGELELAWAGGLVGARVAMAGREPALFLRFGAMAWIPVRRGPKKRSPDRRKAKDGEKKGGKLSLRECLGLLGDGELPRRGIAYARRVMRSLDLRLHLAGEYGTGDPALTGYFTGFLAAVNGDALDLELSPNFAESRLDVQGELRGRIVPLRFLWQTSGFLLTRPVRRMWWRRLTKRKAKSPGRQ